MAHTYTWNSSFETTPADTDDASEGALRIRSTRKAIRERFALDHYMDLSGTNNDHGEHKQVTLRVGAYSGSGEADRGIIYAKDVNSVAELFYYDENGNEVQLTGSGSINAIPSGTKMLFKQSSVPTGWTFVSEDNDRALVNTSTEADGGKTGGSWTIGLSVDGHTLSVNEIPSHNHAMAQNGGYMWEHSTGNDSPDHSGGKSAKRMYNTSYTGGGNAHNHGISGDDGSWRPSYVKVITGQKD